MKFREIQEAQKKKKHKTGKKGQVKGTDKAKSSKPSRQGSQPHPFRGKLVGENQLNEDSPRIQHIEDLIFWEGSQGAVRGLKALKDLEQGGVDKVSLKWDGSPAIAVGRNENGEFVFTHKANFLKKSEDKPTSPEELEDIFAKRVTKDETETLEDYPDYKAFVGMMKTAFEKFQQAVPEDFRGYFLGDMLYFERPEVKDNNFVFKPNVVEYAIDVDSDLGEKIKNSEVGVVIHKKIDPNGNSEDLDKDDLEMFEGTTVFAVPPVSTEEPPVLPEEEIETLKKVIKENAGEIDSLLDSSTLKQNQLTDLPKILYSYLNSKVDTGLDDLAGEFPNWLEQNEKISDKKKNRLAEYINERSDAFNALWQTVATMMNVKDSVISQLDNQDGKIGQTVGDEPGGEGYVLAHPEGDMKLVPRQSFTRINRQSNQQDKGGQDG